MVQEAQPQGEPGVHYVVEIKVTKVTKINMATNRPALAAADAVRGSESIRTLTEMGHITLHDKVLPGLLAKGVKALELIGE